MRCSIILLRKLLSNCRKLAILTNERFKLIDPHVTLLTNVDGVQ